MLRPTSLEYCRPVQIFGSLPFTFIASIFINLGSISRMFSVFLYTELDCIPCVFVSGLRSDLGVGYGLGRGPWGRP